MADSAYDRVAYPGKFFVQSNPDRLGAIGRLRGIDTAPADRARVLELGCGDGNNIIPFAARFPHARVVGVDNSARAITAASARAEATGLRNIELRCQRLEEFDAEAGSFDYVTAHGVFSWIPDEAREALLALASHCLAPNGIAYISYAALPGSLLRAIPRDLARFHARELAEPDARIAAAREVLSVAARPGASDPRLSDIVRRELEAVEGKDYFLLHDMMSEDNEAFYFLDFAAMAARHGLAYLAEAQSSASAIRQLDDAARAFVEATANPLQREQYFDFLFMRQFRCDLLCHVTAPASAGLSLVLLDTLFITSAIRPVDDGGGRIFAHHNLGRLTAEDEATAACAAALADDGAKARQFREITKATEARLGRPMPQEERERCARFMLAMFERGFADLRTMTMETAPQTTGRPAVSALNRILAANAEPVVTGELNTFYLPTPLLRELVPLLDGSRTPEQLAMALHALHPQDGAGLDQRVAGALEFLALNAMLEAI